MSELAALELEHRLAQREKRIHEVELELAKLKEEKEGFRCQLVNERNDYFNEHQRANELESQLAESKKQIGDLEHYKLICAIKADQITGYQEREKELVEFIESISLRELDSENVIKRQSLLNRLSKHKLKGNK